MVMISDYLPIPKFIGQMILHHTKGDDLIQPVSCASFIATGVAALLLRQCGSAPHGSVILNCKYSSPPGHFFLTLYPTVKMLFVHCAIFVLLPFTSSSRTASASSPKITHYLSEQTPLNYETDISMPYLVSCDSSGSSCEDACYNASLCTMDNDMPTIVSCYFPDFGEVCCPDGSGCMYPSGSQPPNLTKS